MHEQINYRNKVAGSNYQNGETLILNFLSINEYCKNTKWAIQAPNLSTKTHKLRYRDLSPVKKNSNRHTHVRHTPPNTKKLKILTGKQKKETRDQKKIYTETETEFWTL